METKNDIIKSYAQSIVEAAISVSNTSSSLDDDADKNAAIIRTLNVLVESVRSQLFLIQSEIDNY